MTMETGNSSAEWPGKDLYEAVKIEMLSTVLLEGGSIAENEVEDYLESLRLYTADKVRRPVAFSHIYFSPPGELVELYSYRLEDKDVIVGQFLGFQKSDEPLKLPIQALVNIDLTPGESPGVSRVETIDLLTTDEDGDEVMRWPNFDSRPLPKRLKGWMKKFAIAG